MTINREIIIMCLIVIAKCLGVRELGDKCGPNSERVCTPAISCWEAREQIRVKQTHDLETCGFLGQLEIVCCETQVVIEPLRASAEACKTYASTYNRKSLTSPRDQYVSLGELPHFAAIGFPGDKEDEIRWDGCGGALISETFVLTVAHCLVRYDGTLPKMVRLGKVDLIGDKDNVTAQDIPVSENIIHPDYHHLERHNNIALIRLSKPAKFSENVNAICLHYGYEVPPEFIAAGWGIIHSGETSKLLKKAFIKAYDLDKCKQTYLEFRRRILDSQFCALGTSEIPCRGDSGNPLQIKNTKKLQATPMVLVGLTAFGKECPAPHPTVFTRVSSYIDWIESIVWP